LTGGHEAEPSGRADDRGGDRSLIARGLGWSTIGYPANVGLLFLSQVVAANLLDPSDFGTYSLAMSIVTLGALIAQLGIPQSLLRRASAADVAGDEEGARHEILSALLVAALAALVAGLLVGSPVGADVLGNVFSGTAIASVAALVGARLGLKVLENVVPEVFRAFRDYMRAVLYDSLLPNAIFAVVLTAAALAAIDLDLSDVLALSVVVSVVALVPAFVAIIRRMGATRGAGLAIRNPVEPAMWAATIGRAVIAQLDLLVVGALGTGREVALYAAPFRLSLMVGLPLIAVNQVVTPLIAGWHATNQRDRLERALRGTAGLALIGAGAFAALLVAAGPWVLTTLFGSAYRDSYGVLVILVVGQVLQTWTGSCGFAMMMTGEHRVYAAVLGASGVLTFGLQIALFEVTGIEGVALATSVMLVAQNVVNMVVLRHRAGLRTMADLRLVTEEVRVLRAARRG
jgi:O-antigen/teichoic acid export membrane protein